MKNQEISTLDLLLEELDIPPSAYDSAEARYKDLGAWFSREESACEKYNPSIYPQGSFRLGTVVRPINQDDEYDLDLGCKLTSGIYKSTHSQQYLKSLVGADLASYRAARVISNELIEKRRCWRLSYRDKLGFHMDVVPSIPEERSQRVLLLTRQLKIL